MWNEMKWVENWGENRAARIFLIKFLELVKKDGEEERNKERNWRKTQKRL